MFQHALTGQPFFVRNSFSICLLDNYNSLHKCALNEISATFSCARFLADPPPQYMSTSLELGRIIYTQHIRVNKEGLLSLLCLQTCTGFKFEELRIIRAKLVQKWCKTGAKWGKSESNLGQKGGKSEAKVRQKWGKSEAKVGQNNYVVYWILAHFVQQIKRTSAKLSNDIVNIFAIITAKFA